MISFIIFEKDMYMRDLYIKVLKKFLYTSHDYYKIHEFSEYNCITKSKLDKIEGKRIYIINNQLVDISGFDLARKIRNDGDVISPVIITAPKGQKFNIRNIKYTMILNIVEQNDTFIKDMLETIEMAYRIATRYSALTFSSFDEVYRLPYEDIYYIEKDINDDTVTIYTKDDTYIHYTSIKKMTDKLSCDPRFLRTHRSCIINLYKVASYNSKDNIIIFDNGMTTKLVSREKKRIVIERLKNDLISV